tara:strand:- start:8795 stop:9145 length:351 start_codon:yes stop_codon:yes gene_type:complete
MAVNPALRNFTLQRASDWSEQYIIETTQADGSTVAMNLTGYTIEAEAWDKERFLKYADFGVTYDDRTNGKFTLTVTDTQTIDFPDELYYDVMLINGSGLKEFYLEGRIKVSEGYTR